MRKCRYHIFLSSLIYVLQYLLHRTRSYMPIWFLHFSMPAETYLTPWDTVAEFQISNSISETPGQIFKLSAEDLNIRSRVWVCICRYSRDQTPSKGFIKFWILNWLGRRKLILSIYINRLLLRFWCLNFRCMATHLKLSAKGLGIRSRIWVWISILVWKSSANVLWLDVWFQKLWQRILGLVCKSRLKVSAGYQDLQRRG